MMQLATTANTLMPLHHTGIVAPKQGEDKLKKVCQQLEGVFFQMMLKEMRKTVEKSDLLPDDQNQTDIFQGMMDDNTAQTMADKDTSNTGMAAMLYAQLSGKKTYAAAAIAGRTLKMAPVAETAPTTAVTEATEAVAPTTAMEAIDDDAHARKATR